MPNYLSSTKTNFFTVIFQARCSTLMAYFFIRVPGQRFRSAAEPAPAAYKPQLLFIELAKRNPRPFDRGLCWHYLAFRVGQRIVAPSATVRWTVAGAKKPRPFGQGLCWRYLSSRVGRVLRPKRSGGSAFGACR